MQGPRTVIPRGHACHPDHSAGGTCSPLGGLSASAAGLDRLGMVNTLHPALAGELADDRGRARHRRERRYAAPASAPGLTSAQTHASQRSLVRESLLLGAV